MRRSMRAAGLLWCAPAPRRTFMEETLRYAAAACQIDRPNPKTRAEIGAKVDHMLGMTRMAVEGYSAFMPVKLLVFPEFGHAAPVYYTSAELKKHLAAS